MEKETATEWLFKQLWDEPKDKFTWNAILMKAKEMEKEQMIKFANDFLFHDDTDLTAEQYYNQKFKKD
jgi:hypothetical protein